jgi:FAD synthase
MYTIRGIVEHGDKRGRELGFPTANITVNGLDAEQETALTGVWAGTAKDLASGDEFTVTVSMGRRPTFYGPGGVFLLEAFVLDFPEGHSRNLYDRDLAVNLCVRLRGQQSFDSLAELIDCMDDDVARTREWAAVDAAREAA